MKLISHLLLLIIGVAIGIWWGLRHPSEAANLDARRQQIVAQAKLDVLRELHDSAAPAPGTSATAQTVVPGDKVQQLLDKSHQELDDANKQLQGQ